MLDKQNMLCLSPEHSLYAIMPQGSIPTPDNVVYNDIIFNMNAQENHVFARFLVFLRRTPCDFHDRCVCSYFDIQGELYYQVQHFRKIKRSPYRTLVE